MRQLLVFILISGMLCWFMFTPVYRHVLIMRHAALQQEVDYLLEIGANGMHGFIDAEMVAASKQRLQSVGFDPDKLEYVIASTSGHDATLPHRPVPRGEGIYLKITYPYGTLFALDPLMGISGPSPNERMGAAGMKMSEYVP